MAAKKTGRPQKPEDEKLKLRAVKLDPELDAQLEAAAYWTRRSMSDIMKRGIELAVEELARKKNGGKPFDPKPPEDED